MADRLIEMTREIYDAFNRGDIEAGLSHMDPEIEAHDRERTGQVYKGPEGMQALVDEWMENWKSFSIEVEDLVHNDDHVLVDARQVGVGKGSGIELSESIHQVLTFRDDKVIRFEVFVERADALEAAGLA